MIVSAHALAVALLRLSREFPSERGLSRKLNLDMYRKSQMRDLAVWEL